MFTLVIVSHWDKGGHMFTAIAQFPTYAEAYEHRFSLNLELVMIMDEAAYAYHRCNGNITGF